jgi:predicted DCC family thiol-disulfide oxidoreductase YuxK
MRAGRSLTVLFDADCPFCAHTVTVLQRLDHNHRLSFVPLQEAASVLPDAPSREELAASLHVRSSDGDWVRGGAACLRIAAALPLLIPLALVGRLPFAMGPIEHGYQAVARNRDRLSRLLGL